VQTSVLPCKWLSWLQNQADRVIKKININGKDLGFEGVESPSVRECLDLHSKQLTDTGLTELKQQHTYDEKEEHASDREGVSERKLL
jgi:hypothetical protein